MEASINLLYCTSHLALGAPPPGSVCFFGPFTLPMLEGYRIGLLGKIE